MEFVRNSRSLIIDTLISGLGVRDLFVEKIFWMATCRFPHSSHKKVIYNATFPTKKLAYTASFCADALNSLVCVTHFGPPLFTKNVKLNCPCKSFRDHARCAGCCLRTTRRRSNSKTMATSSTQVIRIHPESGLWNTIKMRRTRTMLSG